MCRVSADDVIALPLAFSGQRLDWRDLPRHVRTRIAELAGAQVTAEISATSGFSPGFAAVLELADGRGVFVKAVSGEQNPVSPDLARAEIRVARALPPQVPAPAAPVVLRRRRLGDPRVRGGARPLPRAALAARRTCAPSPTPWERSQTPSRCPGTPCRAPTTSWPRTSPAGASCMRSTATPSVSYADLAGDVGRWALQNVEQLVRWEQESLRVCAGGLPGAR